MNDETCNYVDGANLMIDRIYLKNLIFLEIGQNHVFLIVLGCFGGRNRHQHEKKGARDDSNEFC